ncbi:flagellar basal body-associated FliL family protein [Prosthecomicrobium hirschii]|jgi:flagellar FliL protein|uniref:Flagellar protein FliL n=1 Tax=Prosthecodimorpha hirschii TaxID=665126 RepID=A0A0P6W1R3_9HYPH|nr:flagellar basal body-associated FliL family protein [Prosthecomicrobium hirschii]KPL51717.1 flagellar basal body-associated protein FliL [Prosthecomicrobium hirschii]MCW1843981.1 flagellar basal body-associated FliL family protein [Prosthecomicrobium hirschii]TPQ50405.1 flagellar basal body-associated protein FliL [Prosthecomicrobium hirschii]
MAKKPTQKDEAEKPADGDAAKAKKKKMILIGAVGAVVLVGGGGAGAYFMGMFGGKGGGGAHGDAGGHGAPQKDVMFVELPEMTVNLSTVDQRATYLKVRIALEVTDKTVAGKIQPVLPRVLDAFQVYLRELRTSDLDGSAGLFRVKEELAKRVNVAIYPSKIDAVLFKEIIIQ